MIVLVTHKGFHAINACQSFLLAQPDETENRNRFSVAHSQMWVVCKRRRLSHTAELLSKMRKCMWLSESLQKYQVEERGISQFDQGVKRGEGIGMDPLDHVPAEITKRKRNQNEIELNGIVIHTEQISLRVLR